MPPPDDILITPAENGFRASRRVEPLRQFFGRTESDARAKLAAYLERWESIYRGIAEQKAAGNW